MHGTRRWRLYFNPDATGAGSVICGVGRYHAPFCVSSTTAAWGEGFRYDFTDTVRAVRSLQHCLERVSNAKGDSNRLGLSVAED